MGLVTHFGVKNLRSLHETSRIEVRPILLLVGANGSGKSTFLRCFPLLKQSEMHPSTSPILWFGDFVDFGSIGESRTRGIDEPVVFQFTVEIDRNDLQRRFSSSLVEADALLSMGIRGRTSVDIDIELVSNRTGDKTFVHGVDVGIMGRKVSFRNDVQSGRSYVKVFVDDESFDIGAPAVMVTGSGIVPRLMYERQTIATPDYIEPVGSEIIRLTNDLFHAKTSLEKRRSITRRIAIGSDLEMRESMLSLDGGTVWKQRTKNLYIGGVKFKEIRNACFVRAAIQLLDASNTVVTSFARGIRYSGPVRATADRYYRRQELAIDEVDHRGANLAMWMSSMPDTKRKRFTDWCLRNLGFEPRTSGSSGHLSLEVGTGGSYYNLADMGFGFSQMLPVVAQAWESMSPGSRLMLRGIPVRGLQLSCAIEQPELHLHPAFQARMADTFVGVVKLTSANGGRGTRFVIETHSDAIVNRIGAHVAAGNLRPDDVGVLVFEPNSSGGTRVRKAFYESDGTMRNWPYGFFSSGRNELPSFEL